jgi:hypothetical protein
MCTVHRELKNSGKFQAICFKKTLVEEQVRYLAGKEEPVESNLFSDVKSRRSFRITRLDLMVADGEDSVMYRQRQAPSFLLLST